MKGILGVDFFEETVDKSVFKLTDLGVEHRSVADKLLNINYSEVEDAKYVPTSFALKFVNFMKQVNLGGKCIDNNITPVIHLRILDTFTHSHGDVINMLFRGAGKTTINEYLVLYLAVYGEIEGFGEVNNIMFIADSIKNGARKFKENVETRYENSDFLKKMLPKAKFIETDMEFTNILGVKFYVGLFGIFCGMRGVKYGGKRISLIIYEDLLNDKNAASETVRGKIDDVIAGAAEYCLDPVHSKCIWTGTPFDEGDPMYVQANSGAWITNVFPVCEKFPCTEEEFRPAWGDRFTYASVLSKYSKAFRGGKLGKFYAELMLNVTATGDNLVDMEEDIVWINAEEVKRNKHKYNFYITTDFGTSANTSANYSIIAVWAYNDRRVFALVDGVCETQGMGENVDDLFRLCEEYRPRGVGIEVSGQQGGFIPWIRREMVAKGVFFPLVSGNNNSQAGIRPSTNKLQRFQVVVPWFKKKQIAFPKDLYNSGFRLAVEMYNEVKLAAKTGLKSLRDDAIDNLSMLADMTPVAPNFSESSPEENGSDVSGNNFYNNLYYKNKKTETIRISRYLP